MHPTSNINDNSYPGRGSPALPPGSNDARQGHQGGGRSNGNSSTAQTRSGRSIRISHRRTPSELTPLMQENLALQQQIEILQAQQQMLAQQQYATAGLMAPPGVYPPMAPPGLVGIPQLAVPQPVYGYQGGPVLPPQGLGGNSPSPDNHHSRTRSTGSANLGHARRHSLAVSEARRAAQVEQARRAENDVPAGAEEFSAGSPGPFANTSGTGSPGVAVSGPSPPTDESSSFRFPPSPERRHARTSSTHQRSTPSPVRQQFQFPAQSFTPAARHQHHGSQHSHRRSNSRNLDSSWRQPHDDSASPVPSGPPPLPEHGHQQHKVTGHLAPPSAPFVPGHHNRGGSFGSVSSIAAFTESSQNPAQAGRKSLFVPYLSQSTIPQLLAEGLLVAGTLRVNRKNRSDAYVSTDVLDADIFICGSKDRNRALEGDLVAVELLDVNDVWDSKREKEEKKRRRDANDDARLVETASGELRRKGSLKQRPTQKRNDDVEVEGQTLLLKEEEAHTDDTRPLYAGHIVAILERPSGQLFSGTLGLLRPSSQATKERQDAERAEKGQLPVNETKPDRPKIVWFKPTDKCVPLMAIPTEQVPRDFVENHRAYADKIFVASVKRWPITSLHPFGTLVEELGNADDKSVEVKAVLRDNNFGFHKFSNSALQILEDTSSKMLESAEKAQEEGSDERIVVEHPAIAVSSVENLTEQAFYLQTIANGNIELSVHTLDVTPFIREESALDRELRHKSAGVYMQQFASPLIPSEAVTKLVFQNGRAAPALTVTFELDPKSYDVVETPTIKKTVVTPADVIPVTSLSKAHADLFSKLDKIASAFRDQRGASKLAVDQLLDVRVPVLSSLFEVDANVDVVSEINHKVNASIAQKLLAEYGGAALLTRQAEPPISKIESLSTVLKSADVAFDASSASTIGRSIAAVKNTDSINAIQVALIKALSQPKYAAYGRADPLALGHYWFNLPAYTHFTSPLRRYADQIVHRQVHATLNSQRSTPDEEQRIANLCSELTFRYDCAKNVQEQSIHLSLSQNLSDLGKDTGYVLRTGIVIQVYESAFDVVIPELSLEKRVHGDQLPLVKAEFLKKEHALELYWDPKQDAATYAPVGNSSTPKSLTSEEIATATSDKPLKDHFKSLNTRIEGDNYIQEIRALQRVPVLVRADLGVRVLPSIIVRTVNPFFG